MRASTFWQDRWRYEKRNERIRTSVHGYTGTRGAVRMYGRTDEIKVLFVFSLALERGKMGTEKPGLVVSVKKFAAGHTGCTLP